MFVGCFAGEKEAGEQSGGNSKCYVCHEGLKTEEITTNHLAAGVTCDECHGASIEHMHDEMLMTQPDLLFGRSEVVLMCGKCHNGHENPDAVEEFRQKWTGRIRPSGRAVNEGSVCTDCHGTHNIDKTDKSTQEEAAWASAFNGEDLSGWRASGEAWSVKGGRIVAKAAGKESYLWSEAEYEDYLLVVTFRATWPIHAGICVRGDSKEGARVEIFEDDKAGAFAGSVRVGEKGLALVNLRGDLVDRESWNTISIKAEGDRVQVWLNGEEVGAVRTGGPTKGKIGFYIGAGSEDSELCIREVQVQKVENGS